MGVNKKGWIENQKEKVNIISNQNKEELVFLLRWVLKNYYTSHDIDGFFCWENPTGKQFDSIDVIIHYLKEKI